MRDPLLYGDYRTALQPEQPRIYEDIQDYEAAKGLFDEVLCEMLIVCTYLLLGCAKYIGMYIHVCQYTHSIMHVYACTCRSLKSIMRTTSQ